MTTDEQNIAYVRAALVALATYLHGSYPVAPGVSLAEALADPARVMLPAWDAAIVAARIPYAGPVDFDALARFVGIRKGADVEASDMASIGLRALRAWMRWENSK